MVHSVFLAVTLTDWPLEVKMLYQVRKTENQVKEVPILWSDYRAT